MKNIKQVKKSDLVFLFFGFFLVSNIIKMIEFLFKVSLLILGLIVIRFGIIQIRKYKKGEIRSKNNIFSQISFLIFFAAIIGLVIYLSLIHI